MILQNLMKLGTLTRVDSSESGSSEIGEFGRLHQTQSVLISRVNPSLGRPGARACASVRLFVELMRLSTCLFFHPSPRASRRFEHRLMYCFPEYVFVVQATANATSKVDEFNFVFVFILLITYLPLTVYPEGGSKHLR
jgi:hypothetical protein